MKSKQRLQEIQPDPEQQDIALTIKCEDCQTYRTYKITASLFLVMEGRMKSIGVTVECEKCERVIDVAIGRIEGSEGFTKRHTGTGPGFTNVSDNVGLRK